MNSSIIKYLTKKKWIYDGTEYLFRNPKIDDSYIHSEIDCILPKKGQSYTRVKFTDILQTEIMMDVYNMFDEQIGFEVDFFVDGKVAEDVFISEETNVRIRKGLKEIYWFKIFGKEPIDTKFSCEVKIFPSTSKKITTDVDSVDFPFFFDVFNLIYNDSPVTVKESMHREAKAAIENFLLDNDFNTDVADKYYLACEPDFKFSNTDLFVAAHGGIRKIDGVDLGPSDWSWNPGLTPYHQLFDKIN